MLGRAIAEIFDIFSIHAATAFRFRHSSFKHRRRRAAVDRMPFILMPSSQPVWRFALMLRECLHGRRSPTLRFDKTARLAAQASCQDGAVAAGFTSRFDEASGSRRCREIRCALRHAGNKLTPPGADVISIAADGFAEAMSPPDAEASAASHSLRARCGLMIKASRPCFICGFRSHARRQVRMRYAARAFFCTLASHRGRRSSTSLSSALIGRAAVDDDAEAPGIETLNNYRAQAIEMISRDAHRSAAHEVAGIL